jgi:hypothetical protein
MKKCLLILLLFPAISIYSQNIDIDILKDINLNRNKHLDGTFRTITNSAAPLAFGVPVLLFGISLMKKDSLTRQHSFYIGTSVLTSVIISNIIKWPSGSIAVLYCKLQ